MSARHLRHPAVFDSEQIRTMRIALSTAFDILERQDVIVIEALHSKHHRLQMADLILSVVAGGQNDPDVIAQEAISVFLVEVPPPGAVVAR